MLKKWLINGRAAATVQSVMPAILAVVLTIGNPEFCWWAAILAVLGIFCAHIAMNLADDYFDYKADMLEDRLNVVRKGFKAYTAKYPYLTDGSATLKDLCTAILTFTLVALVFGGAIFAFWTGSHGFCGASGSWWILAITALTGFLGVFYSAPPIKFCYWGMGEPVTGLIFGPLLMMGVSCATIGSVDIPVALISVPVGLLVVNILFTHSYIDNVGDEESEKTTLAGLLRTDKACLAMSAILNFLPFAITVGAVIAGTMRWPYLFVLIALPRAIWLFRSLISFSRKEEIDTTNPPKYLGNMGNWEAITKAGLGWYLIRWFTARNTLSAYCLLVIVIRIILIFA